MTANDVGAGRFSFWLRNTWWRLSRLFSRRRYLRDESEMAIDILRHAVILLQDAVLVGDPAPKVEKLQKRIWAPQVGDYVWECSTIHRKPYVWLDAFGKLRMMRGEGCSRVWVIETMDRRLITWTNADFRALPMEWSPKPGNLVFPPHIKRGEIDWNPLPTETREGARP